MTNEQLNTALYEKIFAEQQAFINELKIMHPDEILKHAYEYVIREDILFSLEENDLSDKQCAALLKSNTPLADIFYKFESGETNHMSNVLEVIESRANEINRAEAIKIRAAEKGR